VTRWAKDLISPKKRDGWQRNTWKDLAIISHQGNANEGHNEIPCHCYWSTKIRTMHQGLKGKRGNCLLSFLIGRKMGPLLWKTVWQTLKLKTHIYHVTQSFHTEVFIQKKWQCMPTQKPVLRCQQYLYPCFQTKNLNNASALQGVVSIEWNTTWH
jgi:hypothetical protein